MSDIYLQITETPAVVTLSAPVISAALSSTVTVANVVSVNVVTMPAITVQAAAPSVTTVAGTVTIGSCVTHGVNVANSVTISSLPAISGTVTASNLVYKSGEWLKAGAQYFQRVGDQRWEGGSKANNLSVIYFDDESYLQGWVLDYQVNGRTYYFYAETMLPPAGTWVTEENNDSIQVSYESPFPISGTVTVGSLPVQLSTTTIGGTARLNVTLSSATTIGATAPSYGNLYGGSDGTNLRAISVDTSGRTVVTGSVSVANTVPVSGTFWQATQPVSGTVTANISGTVPVSISSVTIGNTVTVAGTVTASVASTTVTISAQPSGALTTRFGSVTTANTAQITTSVTNTSRKYLLAQNISTGTVTIGIGFSPTTTQGIQLTAGAGLTFDSFVPTGAVYWLGATTGAAYTILEG